MLILFYVKNGEKYLSAGNLLLHYPDFKYSGIIFDGKKNNHTLIFFCLRKTYILLETNAKTGVQATNNADNKTVYVYR